MNKTEFVKTMQMFHSGDKLELLVRGNYGNYFARGKLVKVENGRVYLNQGMTHHYRRIKHIHRIG